MTCFYPKNFPVCDNCIAVREKINRGEYNRPGNGECIYSLQSMSSNITDSSCLPLQLIVITDNSKHIPRVLSEWVCLSVVNYQNYRLLMQLTTNKHTHSLNTRLIPFCSPSMDKAIVKWTNAPTSTSTFSSSIVPLCVPLCIRLFDLEAVAGHFTLL